MALRTALRARQGKTVWGLYPHSHMRFSTKEGHDMQGQGWTRFSASILNAPDRRPMLLCALPECRARFILTRGWCKYCSDYCRLKAFLARKRRATPEIA